MVTPGVAKQPQEGVRRTSMTRISRIIALGICLTVTACAPVQLFPTDATDGIDKDFDFTAWRITPNAKTGQKVQLGGRIVQANGSQ